MSDEQSVIRTAIERNVRAVTLRPSLASGTAVTRVTLEPGLTCRIVDGSWSLVAGMHEKYGGASAGPNPGVLGRGALGACLAICYGMWAARLEVPLTALDVEVQADYDVRGELGVSDDVVPGYREIRYVVTVTSPAAEADVLKVLDIADRYGSWLDVFARANRMVREVRYQAAV